MGRLRKFDISDVEAFSERVDKTRVPGPNRYIIEKHAPTRFATPYHHHTSVEINFLQNCKLSYSFSGKPVVLPPDRLTIFWGAAPHRVINVDGAGQITNIYLSLGQFLRWSLPDKLVEAVLSGNVISAQPNTVFDRPWLERLYSESNLFVPPWRKLHLAEIEARLRRIGLEGWDIILAGSEANQRLLSSAASMLHVEAMLRFIADNFSCPITVGDIVVSASISQGHAMKLFRQVMGISIKEQLTRTRLSHARMLLSETDEKILNVALDSGYKSLSSFYDLFRAANGVSPGRYRQDIRAPLVSE